MRWVTERTCAAAGAAALGAALALYAWGRPAASPPGLALLLGCAPSLLHTFAFTLWTLLALGARGRAAWAVVAGWAALQALVEAFQWPALQAQLPVAWQAVWAGTFDPLDMLAGALGALAAAALWEFRVTT